ncbi:MAG: cell division protein FtsZ, partial [Patescibacteria group bacterium]
AKGVLFSIAGGDDLTMFEIQEAAKIITESVDANAKIIFGTSKDEKLRKGEIKITVIASGFPENYVKKSLFMNKEELTKDKIFNAIPMLNRNKDKEETLDLKTDEKKKETKDDDDDWGAVPAFLRRSKLK